VISLTYLLSADPNITDLIQREHCKILAGTGVGYGKIGSGRTKPEMSQKQLKIEGKLLLTAYMYIKYGFRVSTAAKMYDLE